MTVLQTYANILQIHRVTGVAGIRQVKEARRADDTHASQTATLHYMALPVNQPTSLHEHDVMFTFLKTDINSGGGGVFAKAFIHSYTLHTHCSHKKHVPVLGMG